MFAKSFLFIAFFIVLIHFSNGQTVIQAYSPECEDYEPKVFEKTWPCVWENEIVQWDQPSSVFICHNTTNNNFSVSYSVSNVTGSGIDNTFIYSVSVWDDFGESMVGEDTTLDSQITYIDYLFNNWAALLYRFRKPNYQNSPHIPLQPTSYSYDFTYTEHTMPTTLISTPRSYIGPSAVYISREQYANQFPCFYFLVSITIN